MVSVLLSVRLGKDDKTEMIDLETLKGNKNLKSRSILARLKKIYIDLTNVDPEHGKALAYIRKYCVESGQVLDVGCGYGRFLKPLTTLGYKVTGVEINEDIVLDLQKKNLNSILPQELDVQDKQYDLILMSHIIEHFSPNDLLPFMDNYLSRLKVGGHLIILTPLYSNYFYDDFDHVKPYQPAGIQMVFSEHKAQVQYQSMHHLKLVDLWFRKSPITTSFVKSAYLNSWKTKLYQAKRAFWCLMYRLSFGWIGRQDGWIGVFEKK